MRTRAGTTAISSNSPVIEESGETQDCDAKSAVSRSAVPPGSQGGRRPLGPFGPKSRRRSSGQERSGFAERPRDPGEHSLARRDDAQSAGMVAAVVMQLARGAALGAVGLAVLMMLAVMAEVRSRTAALVLAIAARRCPGGLERNGEQQYEEQEQALHRLVIIADSARRKRFHLKSARHDHDLMKVLCGTDGCPEYAGEQGVFHHIVRSLRASGSDHARTRPGFAQ